MGLIAIEIRLRNNLGEMLVPTGVDTGQLSTSVVILPDSKENLWLINTN